jgi:hypothetical protein
MVRNRLVVNRQAVAYAPLDAELVAGFEPQGDDRVIAAERLDAYTLELQRHGLEAYDREVRWLEELIATERSGRAPGEGNHQMTTPRSEPPER